MSNQNRDHVTKLLEAHHAAVQELHRKINELAPESAKQSIRQAATRHEQATKSFHDDVLGTIGSQT